jgi:hypothetical protein
MLRTTIAVALLSVPASAGTSSMSAQKADYETVCFARERSGADKEKDGSARAVKIAEYLRTHLKTDEVRKVVGELGGELPENRGSRLKREAAKVGYTGRCPIVDDDRP